MLRTRSRSGFTLVELLVVIGVIALLISILLPSLRNARESANAVVCMSNLRQWGIGIQMYADQNKGALPQKGPDGHDAANAFAPLNDVIGYDDPSLWFNSIPPMVNGKSYFQMLWDNYQNPIANPLPKSGIRSIFICPSATDAATADYAETVFDGYFQLFGTESATNPQKIAAGSGLASKGYFPFDGQYVYNSKLISTLPGVDNPEFDNASVRMSMLRPTSQVVLMVEKLNNPGEYKIQDVQTYNKQFSGAYLLSSGPAISTSGYISNIGQTKADWRRFTTRHKNGGNLLFADGHVIHMSWLEAQIQASQMPNGFGNNTDANQPGKLIWSIAGPVQ